MCVYRFLVSTEAAELPVAVVLNKADLVPQQQCDEAVQEVRKYWTHLYHGSVPAVSNCHAVHLLGVAPCGVGKDSSGETCVSPPILQIEAWGYQTIPVSAASGKGLDQLNAVLKDKVSVVAGPSGATPAQDPPPTLLLPPCIGA